MIKMNTKMSAKIIFYFIGWSGRLWSFFLYSFGKCLSHLIYIRLYWQHSVSWIIDSSLPWLLQKKWPLPLLTGAKSFFLFILFKHHSWSNIWFLGVLFRISYYVAKLSEHCVQDYFGRLDFRILTCKIEYSVLYSSHNFTRPEWKSQPLSKQQRNVTCWRMLTLCNLSYVLLLFTVNNWVIDAIPNENIRNTENIFTVLSYRLFPQEIFLMQVLLDICGEAAVQWKQLPPDKRRHRLVPSLERWLSDRLCQVWCPPYCCRR